MTQARNTAIHETLEINIEGHEIRAGYGVRNTSASMIPYLMSTDRPFILVSTGAWCTFMNPFNAEITASDGMTDETTLAG
ncbi:MAG: hypothetical protein MZV63_67015 [Marinilabiliales bacterium]|nr:hypothetical protein [Marinilabiliales bacterium]